MTISNGLQVIGRTEKVYGKVVEVSEKGFKVVEYYDNEYATYMKKDVAIFNIQPQDNSEDYWDEFKKELAKYADLNSVYIEEPIVYMLSIL